MPYNLRFTETFNKNLDGLDKSVRKRLPKLFEKLKASPHSGKPLHGKRNYYRLRFLNFRITYLVKEEEQNVLLIELGNRDKIYH